MWARKATRKSLLMNSRDIHSGERGGTTYDKRRVFGCARGACASGNNGAHDNFDFLLSWLAVRRGLAR